MQEQTTRKDVDVCHRRESLQKIKILKIQKKDLEIEITELLKNYASGKAWPKIYRQFKMYNDPKYRLKFR
jgi:hypothetical protein